MRQTLISKLNLVLIVLIACVLVVPAAIFVPNVMAAEYSDIAQKNNENVKNVTESLVIKQNESKQEEKLALERAKAVDKAKSDAQASINELKQKEAKAKSDAEAQKLAQEQLKKQAQAKKLLKTKAKTKTEKTKAVKTIKNEGYLLGVENPDYNYVSYSINLTAEDRKILEHLVMGEAGDQGYIGCALVAQAIRDTMLKSGLQTVEEVRTNFGYCAGLKNTPNKDVLDAVSYIFDKGGAAVQHNLMFFYETRLCSSDWHETQNYVVTYNTTRFFDIVA